MLTTEMQKSGRVQSRNTLQKPLFDRLFCVLALFSSIELVQNRTPNFLGTDTHTDTIGPDPDVGGYRFRTPKTSLSPQVAPKTDPTLSLKFS